MRLEDIIQTIKRILGFSSSKKELLSPVPTPTPTPTPTPQPDYEKVIRLGFEKYGNPPVAAYAAQFAQIPQKYDIFKKHPYLLPAVSIIETSGGKNMKFKNNPLNWGKQDMPSVEYVIDKAASGISGRFPYYKDFLETGDLKDFIKVYAPPHENERYEEKLNWALSLFGEEK